MLGWLKIPLKCPGVRKEATRLQIDVTYTIHIQEY